MKLLDEIKFDEKGLVPAIIVEDSLDEVLTLCYMNREALRKTLETGRVHVFRRSAGRIMLKGESSGHTQDVVGVYVDCEENSILIRVRQKVAGCHKGYMSCYFRRYDPASDSFEITAERIFDPSEVYKK